MADTSAPVNSAVTASENATTKNPFADTQTTNSSDSATPGVSKPLVLAPDVHKPAGTSADTVNGGAAAPSVAPTAAADSVINGNGVHGTESKPESLVPEETKQTSGPAASAVKEVPASSELGASAPSSSSASAQPPVMTGALPEDHQSNSKTSASDLANLTAKDGVEDVAAASAVPKPAVPAQTDDAKVASASSAAADDKASVLNGEKKHAAVGTTSSTAPDEKNDPEKKEAVTSAGLAATEKSSAAPTPAVDPVENRDVEMKDAASIPASEKQPATDPAPAPAPAPVAAPVIAPATDITGLSSTTGVPTATPALATSSTVAAEATGGKRKAPADAEDGAEEPVAKKHKGAFSRAMDKAKEAVKDVKEKAKPGRKPGKKEKKEVAPVGRTERKTRSQARAE